MFLTIVGKFTPEKLKKIEKRLYRYKAAHQWAVVKAFKAPMGDTLEIHLRYPKEPPATAFLKELFGLFFIERKVKKLLLY